MDLLLVLVLPDGVLLVEEVDGVLVDRSTGAPVDVELLEAGILVGVEVEGQRAA